MKLFTYNVKDKEGKILKGVIEAESEDKLIEHFHKQECLIFSISEIKKKHKFKKGGRVKADDLVIFSRQFTTLIESGIPLVSCLDILEKQTENNYFKKVLNQIVKEVKEGMALSAALSKHKNVFPDIYLSMVAAAEASGNLPEILDRVSVYLEKSSVLRKKIKAAFYYPAVVMLVAIAATTFLLVKIVPTFKEMYGVFKAELPLPTRILISISDILTKKEFLIGVLILGSLCLFGLKKYVSTSSGKRKYHQLLLRLPVFGKLIRELAIARFSRSFSTLVRSGVSIMKCLDIVADTSGNKVIAEAVIKSKKAIQEGQTISTPLEETRVFPPMVIKMIAIGEKSGRLEDMLSKIAQFYEEQTDALVAGLSSLIEPIIIVVLGTIVGGIVIAMFLPIIELTQHIA